MIENHIHDNLQALLMASIDELTILGIAAEAGIDTIVVRAGITVIG